MLQQLVRGALAQSMQVHSAGRAHLQLHRLGSRAYIGIAPSPQAAPQPHLSKSTRSRGQSKVDARGPSMTQQVGEYVARQVGAGVLDLGVGQPAPHTLPLELFQAATHHRLTPNASSTCDPMLLLQYGPFRGYRSFRAALAKLLTQRYRCDVGADNLMVTAGVSHGLDLACRHLSEPGDVVAVECPSYFLAGPIFRQNRLQQLPCHMDDNGLDTAHLEQLLQSKQHSVKLLYTIPVHHNPRGVTLSGPRREHLVRLAHEYSFTIVADEVYQMLSFQHTGAETLRPLRWYEQAAGLTSDGRPSRVVSLGSFSKILAPGLRLGWVEAGPDVLSALARDGVITSGGSLQLATGVAHSALELGLLEGHLDGIVLPHLQAGCDALCTSLREALPECVFTQPSGGYFLWLRLPPGMDGRALLAHADALSTSDPSLAVRFTPGALCGEGAAADCIRLCFAFYTPDELRAAAQRLAAVVRSFQDTHQQPQTSGQVRGV